MRMFASAKRRGLVCVVSAYLLSVVSAVYAEELTAPDPLKTASGRLRNLSTFVDKHLQTVEIVNKAASNNKAAANKNLSVDFSGLSQLGGNRTIANMMRFKELESSPTDLKLDFLQDHRRQMETFSQSFQTPGAEGYR